LRAGVRQDEHRGVLIVPAVTAIVAGIFALVVVRQYLGHHKPYQLVWAIGFALFGAAAFAGYLARSGGPSETEYRVFYVLGAILNVVWLGLGTIYLLARRTWANAALVAVALFTVIAVYAVWSSPVNLAAAVTPTGRAFADGSLPRTLALIGNVLGSVVLVGGALWSAWIFLRKRRNGRRALANVIIAVGVFIVAAGGTATFTGAGGVLELANLVGLSVMFAGFLLIG
jgi:drug/metabolite transporter (DMT)-like permease